jgi:hypothetical protein
VDSLFAHVDAIIHQGTELINLQFASVLITFQKNCDLATSARIEAEAGKYNKSRDQAELETYQAGFEELNSTRKVEDRDTESREGTCDWETDRTTDWDYDVDGEYNSADDECGCYSAFGMDDDGEVRHYGMKCQYKD